MFKHPPRRCSTTRILLQTESMDDALAGTVCVISKKSIEAQNGAGPRKNSPAFYEILEVLTPGDCGLVAFGRLILQLGQWLADNVLNNVN